MKLWIALLCIVGLLLGCGTSENSGYDIRCSTCNNVLIENYYTKIPKRIDLICPKCNVINCIEIGVTQGE